MKRFVLKLSLIAVISAALFYVYVKKFAGEKTDYFYNKLLNKGNSSMIIGSSRSAQGIVPDVLKEKLGPDFYNFAFTNVNSPFGPVYLTAIKHKLSQVTTGGIYIIEVTPYSVSMIDNEEEDDLSTWRENGSFLDKPFFLNTDPNFEYLFNSFGSPFYKIFMNRRQANNPVYLHDNGWLELKLDYDSAGFAKKAEQRVEDEKEKIASGRKLSENRFKYLKETVQYLGSMGRVIIVRMPFDTEVKMVEDQFMPEFTSRLKALAGETKCEFLDMTDLNWQIQTIDGVHLYRTSSIWFTEKLAEKLSAGK